MGWCGEVVGMSCLCMCVCVTVCVCVSLYPGMDRVRALGLSWLTEASSDQNRVRSAMIKFVPKAGL